MGSLRIRGTAPRIEEVLWPLLGTAPRIEEVLWPLLSTDIALETHPKRGHGGYTWNVLHILET